MGVAILSILLTHLNCDLGSFTLNRIALCCQGGVDAFFFMSGFGLYYSAQKSYSPLTFYKRRAMRIFPVFLCLFTTMMLVQHNFTWQRLFWGGSTLAYWFPATRQYMFGWFVSVIILLYAIFPTYSKWFAAHRKTATAAAVISGLTLTSIYAVYFMVLHPGQYNQYILASARVPIFFIGIYAAWLSQRPCTNSQRNKIRAGIIAVSCVSFLLYNMAINQLGFMTMRNTGLLYLPFILIVPGVCILLGLVFCEMEKHTITRYALNMLQLAGQCTLEAYLLIGITYRFSTNVAQYLGTTNCTAKILIAAFTLLFAWCIHTCITYITNKIQLNHN